MSEGKRIQISRPWCPNVDALVPELSAMLESGQLTNGKQVRRFEEAVRDRLGHEGLHVVALSSNTSGMILAWRALATAGEVLVPAFTFPATAHALLWNGLTPVLVDCDPDTFNIDVADARRKCTERTVGIAPVYIFGNAPDWEAIEALCTERNLRCVADAAHAFGTRVGSAPAGAFGDCEVFSLAPTKVLTTAEGGLVVTRDSELARQLERTRNYGNPGDYNCRELGMNARMTEVHALIGIHALPEHEKQLVRRDTLAERYRETLGSIPGISFQRIAPHVRSTHNYFAIRIEPEVFGARNADVQRVLAENGIESKIYFHPPIHEQSLYASLSDGTDLPNTAWLCARILCLPLTAHVTEADIVRIGETIRSARPETVER